MKHQTIEQVAGSARLTGWTGEPMSAGRKVEYWAELLEADPGRCLNTLRETEYRDPSSRAAMRGENSPISVAFADPTLRAEGMRDDTYGEARRFFELSDRQMHEVLCYCRFGNSVRSGTVGRALRRIRAEQLNPGFLRRVGLILSGWRGE